MQQDNIKDFAIAAFRYRGHLNDTDILSLEEVYINMVSRPPKVRPKI